MYKINFGRDIRWYQSHFPCETHYIQRKKNTDL